MDEEAKKVIDAALEFKGKGGVRTYPLITGEILTNFVPFRVYFSNNVWTSEMSNYVKSLFKEEE